MFPWQTNIPFFIYFNYHIFLIFANNEDICLKFLPDTSDHTHALYKIKCQKVKLPGHVKDTLA